jgi:hypothetical protein
MFLGAIPIVTQGFLWLGLHANPVSSQRIKEIQDQMKASEAFQGYPALLPGKSMTPELAGEIVNMGFTNRALDPNGVVVSTLAVFPTIMAIFGARIPMQQTTDWSAVEAIVNMGFTNRALDPNAAGIPWNLYFHDDAGKEVIRQSLQSWIEARSIDLPPRARWWAILLGLRELRQFSQTPAGRLHPESAKLYKRLNDELLQAASENRVLPLAQTIREDLISDEYPNRLIDELSQLQTPETAVMVAKWLQIQPMRMTAMGRTAEMFRAQLVRRKSQDGWVWAAKQIQATANATRDPRCQVLIRSMDTFLNLPASPGK